MITASDYDYCVQLTKFFLQIHSQQMQEIVHLSNSQLLFYRIYHPIFSIKRLDLITWSTRALLMVFMALPIVTMNMYSYQDARL